MRNNKSDMFPSLEFKADCYDAIEAIDHIVPIGKLYISNVNIILEFLLKM